MEAEEGVGGTNTETKKVWRNLGFRRHREENEGSHNRQRAPPVAPALACRQVLAAGGGRDRNDRNEAEQARRGSAL
jgi:hypothetical protein